MTLTTKLIITQLHNQKLLQKANTLPQTGIMVQQENYSFLKVSDSFIHDLYPLLVSDNLAPNNGITKPNYFSPPLNIGAHITFAYPEENVLLESGDLGKQHAFSIKGLNHALLDQKEYFVLTIASPSLNELRAHYNLHPQPQYKNNKIDFHVTVGIRK